MLVVADHEAVAVILSWPVVSLLHGPNAHRPIKFGRCQTGLAASINKIAMIQVTAHGALPTALPILWSFLQVEFYHPPWSTVNAGLQLHLLCQMGPQTLLLNLADTTTWKYGCYVTVAEAGGGHLPDGRTTVS